jgi:hypothetical protein
MCKVIGRLFRLSERELRLINLLLSVEIEVPLGNPPFLQEMRYP